ncbi:DUF1292 domain-containing protein [Ureibacillus sp. FSL K6-3587]|uniref:DUF1292 domain-containing protein n=1 Tax=unclassified Ureibacillus TaxID=2638520 RepID=UPI003158F7A9
MDQQLFKLETENGIKTCKVLFTFDTDDHSYCIYSIVDEEGNESDEISAVRYELDENLEMTNFQELETEEEWDMVEEVYNTLIDTFSEDKTFTAVDEEGNEVECKIVHQFAIEDFGKSYVIYSIENEEENSGLYAASYVSSEDGAIQEIFPIESEEEWKKVEQTFELLNQSNR